METINVDSHFNELKVLVAGHTCYGMLNVHGWCDTQPMDCLAGYMEEMDIAKCVVQ